jgi:hypothetical protein
MANEKKYAKGIFANEKQTQYGSLMNIDVKVSEFIEFVKENTNDKGYCKLTVMKAKEGGKNSHYVVVNDWKPVAKAQPQIADDDQDLPF